MEASPYVACPRGFTLRSCSCFVSIHFPLWRVFFLPPLGYVAFLSPYLSSTSWFVASPGEYLSPLLFSPHYLLVPSILEGVGGSVVSRVHLCRRFRLRFPELASACSFASSLSELSRTLLVFFGTHIFSASPSIALVASSFSAVCYTYSQLAFFLFLLSLIAGSLALGFDSLQTF